MIRQNFNADWTVEKGDGNSRMNSFLGNTQTKTVHLPYDAMIHEARTPDTKTVHRPASTPAASTFSEAFHRTPGVAGQAGVAGV